jgi:glycosyltransferase involved in cell wall biosynthesis
MNIAIFLSFGESIQILKDAGQDERFINYYLKPYSEAFEKIYIFSWANEVFEFPFKNIVLVPNIRNTNPYYYNLTLPFVYRKILKECSVVRLMQFTSIVPAAISKLFYGNKIVATYGFPYSESLKVRGRKLQLIIWRMVERFLLATVNRFIATYQKTVNYLSDRGVSLKKISILPNGVDIEVFKPLSKERDGRKMELLFVGRFGQEKNVINMAKALGLLENKNFSITLIGRGTMEKDVRKILNDHKIDYEILSPLPHNKLVDKYQSADIFLLPSVEEGYPKVLIEAMACGLPCIVGKYPGYSDIITNEENGIVCEFDPESIAKAINRLMLNLKLRKQLSKNSRKFVEKNNDIKNIVSKEIELIQSLNENH